MALPSSGAIWRLAASPRKGEANLSRPSVVNVTQLWTIDRDRLTQRIGVLSPERIAQVLQGVRLLFGLD